MRYPASEKGEIIRIVEQSPASTVLLLIRRFAMVIASPLPSNHVNMDWREHQWNRMDRVAHYRRLSAVVLTTTLDLAF